MKRSKLILRFLDRNKPQQWSLFTVRWVWTPGWMWFFKGFIIMTYTVHPLACAAIKRPIHKVNTDRWHVQTISPTHNSGWTFTAIVQKFAQGHTGMCYAYALANSVIFVIIMIIIITIIGFLCWLDRYDIKAHGSFVYSTKRYYNEVMHARVRAATNKYYSKPTGAFSFIIIVGVGHNFR